jgi:hypothetical protein
MENLMHRRHFLRGTGALLTLPTLEAFADEKKDAPPLRLMFLGFPWGVTRNHWFPETTGKDFQITKGLQPLSAHKDDLTIFKNISPVHSSHSAHNTLGYFLTSGDHTRPKGGAYDLVSCDQLAAETLGIQTRYSSLEISGRGNNFMSRDRSGKPVPGHTDPLALYHHLFSDGKVSLEERRQMIRRERSIMDAFRDQSRSLEKKISIADKDKLDEYFTSIRQIEKDLAKAEQWAAIPKPKPGLQAPKKGLRGTAQVEVMYDLMVAAIQTDMTRVIAFQQPLDRILGELSLGGAHGLNHAPESEKALARDIALSKLLSHLLDKLKATKEYDGSSLFDNTILSYGSGVCWQHGIRDLPIIVTGKGKGRIRAAGFVELEEGKNRLSNLWLTILQSAGLELDAFSHSNGLIDAIRA